MELHVELTPAMRACQAALLDLIDGCVKELKLGNTRVRGQDTVEEMKQSTQVFKVLSGYECITSCNVHFKLEGLDQTDKK